MTAATVRLRWLAVPAVLALLITGCGETEAPSPDVEAPPLAPALAPDLETPETDPLAPAVDPDAAAPSPIDDPLSQEDAPEDSEVALIPVTLEEYQAHLASNPTGAKYQLVDAWATWCAPCKENFPHVVEMHQKYGAQGLAVISLSLDDPSDADAVQEAREFLREQNAVFTNFLLNEEFGEGHEFFDIKGIPAVFLYGPDGQELKRFTGDDPNNQFTYEQVEAEVIALLEGEATSASE